MKRIKFSILIALISFFSVSAHDLKYDTFSFNTEDSTCTLISTKGTEATRQHPYSESIARSYGEHIYGYKFISVGDGRESLNFISSLSLPASIQYINDYSLSDVEGGVTIPKENDLRYIGAYGLPGRPFDNCKIYINKNCNIHPDAFISQKFNGWKYGHVDPVPLYGSGIEIDPKNPYWGLENGILYQKGTTDVVKYLVHKDRTFSDTIFIPKRFSKIEYYGGNYSYSDREIVRIEDFSTLKSLNLPYCDILNEEDLYFNSMDTVKVSLAGCKIKSNKIVFPNAKVVSYVYVPKKTHLIILNVEDVMGLGELFTGNVDTLSVYVKNNLGNKLFAEAKIGRLNWLNEDIPFAESMEAYGHAEQINVLNLGNAKAVGIRGLMYTFKKRSEESIILLSTPTPPEVLSMVLYEDIPKKVKLYVPAGSGETYRNHEKWGVIPNIIEYDVNGPDPTSGVETIINDNAQNTVDVYTLQGSLVRKGVKREEATQGLPQGVYIIGGEKVIVK